MRVATKLLLAFTIFMLTAAVRCGGGSTFPTGPTVCPPPNGQCGWPAFSSYTVMFPDGTQRNFSTGINGCIAYSPRNGQCGVIIRGPSSFGFSLTADPGSVNLQAPPSAGNIYGPGGMSTANGMPTAEYYDQYGYFIGSVAATAVSGDGTWLSAPQPDMSNIYSGNYTVVVANADGQTVGTANVSTWGRDRPDSDGDGWYDDEDCYPYDPYYNCSQPPPDNNCNNGGWGGPVMECPVY